MNPYHGYFFQKIYEYYENSRIVMHEELKNELKVIWTMKNICFSDEAIIQFFDAINKHYSIILGYANCHSFVDIPAKSKEIEL